MRFLQRKNYLVTIKTTTGDKSKWDIKVTATSKLEASQEAVATFKPRRTCKVLSVKAL